MGARSTNPTQSFFDDFFRSGTDAVSAASPAGLVVTGGTTTPAGIAPGNGYRYHVFTSSGSLVVSNASPTSKIEFLVVGGGGQAGGYYGGGAGGGGVRSNDPEEVNT